MAAQIRNLLPIRAVASGTARVRAKTVFAAALATLENALRRAFKAFGIRAGNFHVEKLYTPLPAHPPAASGSARGKASARQRRQSLEYYWTGRRVCNGHRQIRMMKAETDQKGNLLRTSVLHSS
jgi:hypothetical protein